MSPRKGDAGTRRDVLEAPAAEGLVQDVRAIVACEIDVGEAVAVHVAQGHATPLGQVAVPECAVEGDAVGEPDAGPGGGELAEPRAPARGHAEVAPAIPRLGVPRGGWRGAAARGSQRQQREARCEAATPAQGGAAPHLWGRNETGAPTSDAPVGADRLRVEPGLAAPTQVPVQLRPVLCLPLHRLPNLGRARHQSRDDTRRRVYVATAVGMV